MSFAQNLGKFLEILENSGDVLNVLEISRRFFELSGKFQETSADFSTSLENSHRFLEISGTWS